jgi:hypothetical protein
VNVKTDLKRRLTETENALRDANKRANDAFSITIDECIRNGDEAGLLAVQKCRRRYLGIE